MNTSKLKTTLLAFLVLSLISTLNGCVTMKDATTCTASGLLTNGGICSHMIASWTFKLSLKETIDLIDAQPIARTCIPVGAWTTSTDGRKVWEAFLPVCADDQTLGAPTVLPPRGAAIIMTPADWGEKKEEGDVACRELGAKCSLGLPIPAPSSGP